MEGSHRRYDISDSVWSLIAPHTIGNKGTWGGNAKDTRLFINAVFWILRTGAPWRDLPPDYGNWNTVERRFCRWRDKGIWERILETLINEPDFEQLLIDASHIKVHPHATGALAAIKIWANKRGLNSKIRLAVDANGMPVRVFVAAGTTADCKYAAPLIDGFPQGRCSPIADMIPMKSLRLQHRRVAIWANILS